MKIKNSVKSALAILTLAGLCYVFNNLEFNSIERFTRDALQFLNNSKHVNQELVTLTIDSPRVHPNTQYDFQIFHKIIVKLQSMNPRSIVIAMEPLDFSENISEKKKLYKFLISQKNIYINGFESRNGGVSSFENDLIFAKYPRLIHFYSPRDQSIDKKNRRAVIQIYQEGYSALFQTTKDLGLTSFPASYFKHSFEFWGSEQAYLKAFPLSSYGNYLSTDLLADRTPEKVFHNKVVFVGIHDEFSFLALSSIFNIFNKAHNHDVRANSVPFHHILANLINFHSTGNYIKYLQNFNPLPIIFCILSLFVILKINMRKKLLSFLILIPVLLVTQVLLYTLGDYYIDFSKTIALLLFIQYLALPAMLFVLLQNQERRKLKEIHNARIDALFAVSEKVAHDIRSPLSAVKLLLNKAQFDNPEFREIVISSIQRIDEISENILKQHKNPSSNKREEIDLTTLLSNLIKEKKVLNENIIYSVATSNHFALGSESDLIRAISNILDNSIYALKSSSSGKIDITVTKSKPKYLTINITDNGPGISPEILKILGKEQITTKSGRDGHGIGLLHTKRLIENMNGTFDIKSSPSGTIILLALVEYR